MTELLRGNLPSFLRRFVPVRLARELAPGETTEAWVWVSSDYLAIGSEEDFLRMTREVMALFDQAVREHPDQYLWYNKRWVLDPV